MLLVSINAKYSHTSLGIKSIKSYVEKFGFKIDIAECTINDNYFSILKKIMDRKPDIIGFSCYIWNIEIVKQLVSDIKAIDKNIKVFLGGPEVSYNDNIFNECEADFIIAGEGEAPVLSIMQENYNCNGIWNGKTPKTYGDIVEMDEIPFVYSENELLGYTNRAVYYETSRGCPFNCSFCISSVTKGVRELPLKRVFKELDMFIKAKIRKVKLVDRTFNCNKERAYKIFEYIINNSTDTCFHFEIGADLLDDKILSLLRTAKKGQIQFEAGIQSTNEKTLELVDRKTNFEKLKHNVEQIKQCPIRLHLDLIAGLPGETYEIFKNSFNEAFMLNPDILQLGFLKLLHGSKIRREYEKYHYAFRAKAPYEVLSNDFISFDDLMKLKQVEEALDIYNNGMIFNYSVKFILENCEISPFDLFYELGEIIARRTKPPAKEYFVILDNFYREKCFEKYENFSEYLKLDYFVKNRGALPEIFKNYKTKELVSLWAESYENEHNMSHNEVMKRIDFEKFVFGEKSVILAADRINNIICEIKN